MEYRQTIPQPIDGPCLKCQLHESCKSPKMLGMGSESPTWLFVGEAPGATEDKYNQPFIGRAGQLLKDTLVTLEFDLDQCRFTNAVRCRPEKNKTPPVRVINYCREFIEDEIERYNPKVVVMLGNVPLKSVLQETGITAFNGTVIQRSDRVYVPVFHPAYILRNDNTETMDKWLLALMAAQDAGNGVVNELEYTIEVPETLDELDEMMANIVHLHKETGHNIGYDVESKNKWPESKDNYVSMCSLAVGNYAMVIPLYHKESWFDRKTVSTQIVPKLAYILTNYPTTGHNIRFDQKMTKLHLGIDFQPAGDTLNLSRLVNAHDTWHGLKRLSAVLLNMYDYDKEVDEYIAEHPECNPNKGGDFSLIPLDILIPYSGLDSINCSLIEQKLYPQLTEKQRNLYHQIIQPISHTLGRIESNGFLVDRRMALRHKTMYEAARQRYYVELTHDPDVAWYINYMSGEKPRWEYNPNSDVQMREVIFGVKGYTPIAYTKSGQPSVSWQVIKEYKDEEPFFETFRMWKLLNGVVSKYLRPPVDGDWFFGGDDRCRVNFNLGGASSGRLSSSDPTNLQNIPTSEKEYGTILHFKPIKNIFTASAWHEGVPFSPYHLLAHLKELGDGSIEDYITYLTEVRGRLLKFDFSGQELRVMASIANVPGMINAFNEGRDIHSFVTAMLFGLPEHLIKSHYNHMRYRAKWVNWTLLYGGNEFTLHRLYGLAQHEAKELMNKYYGAFPEILDFQKETKKFIRKHGYVESVLGRRLKLHYTTQQDKERNPGKYNKDLRTGINFPIQGVASDMMLMAMVIIQDQLDKFGLKSMLVNTVHDSVVLDTPIPEIDQVTGICVNAMENLPTLGNLYFPDIDLSWLKVNLKADVDIGKYYGSH